MAGNRAPQRHQENSCAVAGARGGPDGCNRDRRRDFRRAAYACRLPAVWNLSRTCRIRNECQHPGDICVVELATNGAEPSCRQRVRNRANPHLRSADEGGRPGVARGIDVRGVFVYAPSLPRPRDVERTGGGRAHLVGFRSASAVWGKLSNDVFMRCSGSGDRSPGAGAHDSTLFSRLTKSECACIRSHAATKGCAVSARYAIAAEAVGNDSAGTTLSNGHTGGISN